METKYTVEVVMDESPSQRGKALVLVGVRGPGIAKVRVSSEYYARQSPPSISTLEAEGVAV